MIKREDICDLFNIFHDGTFENGQQVGGVCDLTIEIKYLAALVQSNFTSFSVQLIHPTSFTLFGWPRKLNEVKKKISVFEDIFAEDLLILDAKYVGDNIEVSCNIADMKSAFCGGELLFSCDHAIVTDQSTKSWSIEELDKLCCEYWNEWQQKGLRPT